MSEQRIVVSYLGLRKLIGLIGMAHPLVLYVGGVWLFGIGLQSSMSAYYHTGMRDVFVGLGFVTGTFLLCYRGYDKHDRIVSVIAGAAAIVVALFPIAGSDHPNPHEVLSSKIHMSSAFVFLLALAYFCLVLFPKGATVPQLFSIQKKKRNTVYRVSGVLIILSLVAAAAYFLIEKLHVMLEPWHPIFFLEAISFVSFGIAWLVKGQAILAD